jgi:hypothetical protein
VQGLVSTDGGSTWSNISGEFLFQVAFGIERGVHSAFILRHAALEVQRERLHPVAHIGRECLQKSISVGLGLRG